jgi:hypothetical protein
MQPTIRFPDPADVMYEEAQAFRRLTPSERLTAILDLMASGLALIAGSPNREAARHLQVAQEEEWRRIQKELFRQHGF